MAASGSAPRTGRLPALAKYEVIEELGHGGMATVYRAHDRRLARDVAVKVIHPHLRDSQEVAHRFFVEAKAVAKLRHPNIVEVFDVSSEGEPEQYLVVELLRGLTLRKLLQRTGAIPPEIAAALGIELLNALAHAHAHGVVHRDVKPENVMIEHRPSAKTSAGAIASTEASARAQDGTSDSAQQRVHPTSAEPPGERVLVKLTDFGIAKLLDAQGVTSTGQVLGSPAHMAPEQIEGGEVDARADVFGIGVLLYECMVGHLPFEGNNPAQVLRRVLDGIYPSAEREKPSIGKGWSAILDRALARSAAERFPDAMALREALERELKRLDQGVARAELEAWLDDPEAYVAAHDKAMIGRLCGLGEAARKRGDALAAAADYNRALAYAPHDPALLKIVAGMHRTEARRRLVRRLAPIALATLSLGVAAFFATRALRPRVDPRPAASASVSAVASSSASPSASAPVAFGPPASAKADRPAPVPAPLPVRPPPPQKAVERAVVVGNLRPQFGVLYAIDGDAAGRASAGLRIVLDGKAHQLTFTCMNDACEPVTKAIAAGDDPETTIDIELSVRPALLVVDGNPAMTYGIEELPSVVVRMGVPVRVPVPRGNYVIHVIERPSGRRVSVTLDPGKERHAAFAADSP
jgi:serine/threonine-protein kinase